MSLIIRSSAIRLGIFISSLVIAAILIFQLVWLKKIYRYEQKEFDHSVVKAVRGLYEDLDIKEYNVNPLNRLIETPKPNLYLARSLYLSAGIHLSVTCNTNWKILRSLLIATWVFTRLTPAGMSTPVY